MRVDDQNRRIGGVSLDRKQSLTKNLDRRTTPQRIYETTVLRYLLLDYHHLPPCSVLLPAVSTQRTSAGEIIQEPEVPLHARTHDGTGTRTGTGPDTGTGTPRTRRIPPESLSTTTPAPAAVVVVGSAARRDSLLRRRRRQHHRQRRLQRRRNFLTQSRSRDYPPTPLTHPARLVPHLTSPHSLSLFRLLSSCSSRPPRHPRRSCPRKSGLRPTICAFPTHDSSLALQHAAHARDKRCTSPHLTSICTRCGTRACATEAFPFHARSRRRSNNNLSSAPPAHSLLLASHRRPAAARSETLLRPRTTPE